MKILELIQELTELYEENDKQNLDIVFYNQNNVKYEIQTFEFENSLGWSEDSYFIDITKVEGDK